MNLRPATRWIVLTILAGACALVFAAASRRVLRDQALFAQAPSLAMGTVTAVTRPAIPKVFYRFEAGGKTWIGDFEAGRDEEAYHQGERLPIFYLASNPRVHAVRKPTSDDLSNATAICVTLGGFVVLFTTLVAHRWLTKSRREPFCLDTREFPGWWAA